MNLGDISLHHRHGSSGRLLLTYCSQPWQHAPRGFILLIFSSSINGGVGSCWLHEEDTQEGWCWEGASWTITQTSTDCISVPLCWPLLVIWMPQAHNHNSMLLSANFCSLLALGLAYISSFSFQVASAEWWEVWTFEVVKICEKRLLVLLYHHKYELSDLDKNFLAYWYLNLVDCGNIILNDRLPRSLLKEQPSTCHTPWRFSAASLTLKTQPMELYGHGRFKLHAGRF